jgi:hypothetical protein
VEAKAFSISYQVLGSKSIREISKCMALFDAMGYATPPNRDKKSGPRPASMIIF